MRDSDVPLADRGHPLLRPEAWTRGRAWLLLLPVQLGADVLASVLRRHGRTAALMLCRVTAMLARVAAVAGLVVCVVALVQHEWAATWMAAAVSLLGAFALGAVRQTLPFVADGEDRP